MANPLVREYRLAETMLDRLLTAETPPPATRLGVSR
jgi:hypothetical protein